MPTVFYMSSGFIGNNFRLQFHERLVHIIRDVEEKVPYIVLDFDTEMKAATESPDKEKTYALIKRLQGGLQGELQGGGQGRVQGSSWQVSSTSFSSRPSLASIPSRTMALL